MQEVYARIAQLEQQLAERDALIAQLSKELEALKEQLGKSSRNSSKPPSSDSPAERNKRKEERRKRREAQGGKQKKRKRGGQKGHQGSHRQLRPESDVDEVVHHYPDDCENCWKSLGQVPDPDAGRHQVTELPPIKPLLIEHRCHTVRCDGCGHATRASRAAVPRTTFGPRLTAAIALLTGVFTLSRRQAQQAAADLFGATMSLGALSGIEKRVTAALKPGVDEAWQEVHNAKVKHADGTGWKFCGKAIQLWVIATCAATVFKVVMDGGRTTLRALFGDLKGILNSDRAAALDFWSMARRQICWAHLLRLFISFSERAGAAGRYGRQLVEYTSIVFEYWRNYKSGNLSREAFAQRMAPLRRQVEAMLREVRSSGVPRLSGSCANLLKYREALWNFVDQPNVEPTNNHGEQEVRAFVLWRRKCFGAQSLRGNEYAESIMTIQKTARKQKKNVFRLLTDYCCAYMGKTTPPRLLNE